MNKNESICDCCLHGCVCDFKEKVCGDWDGHEECPYFLGFVATKSELPNSFRDVLMVDKWDIPFVGWYNSNKKCFVDESMEKVVEFPEYWLKGLKILPTIK